MKALLRKILMFLFKDEIEAIEEDLKARIEISRSEIAHDLINDTAFIYEVAEMIILDGDLASSVESNVEASINRLEMRIDELEERENN